MKHGEQLAPLIARALEQAGIVRQDLTAVARRRRARPVHRAAGRAGHRPHPRLRARRPGLRRLLARRARRRGRRHRRGDRAVRGRHRRAPQGGLPRLLRRRRRPASTVRSSTSRPRSPRTCRWWGRARRSTRRRSRAAVGPSGPQRRLAGWRGAEERAELLDPEPLYLRRPDAEVPGAEARVVTVRAAAADDADAVAALEEDNLGVDAWSPGLVREGIAGDLPTVRDLVAEEDGVVVGHAVASVGGRHRRAAADRRRRPRTAAPGWPPRCSTACWRGPRVGGADRLLLEVREDNAGALRFYAARGLRRDRPAPALLPRRHDRGRAAATAGRGLRASRGASGRP